jgi:competence protein ComEA
MLKKILAFVAMLYATACFAAVDVNKANAAELDSIKGIGPAISTKIIDERKKKGSFKDWNDFIARVRGVGEGNAAKFSAEGLTVNGEAFKSVAAAKKEEKKAAKEEKREARAEAKQTKVEAAKVTAGAASAAKSPASAKK